MIHSLKQHVLVVFLIFIIVSISSCVNTHSSKTILGVYEVYERDCRGSIVAIKECEAIIFIEFVKGNFYKISDNDVAFVIWRKEESTELLYSARKYDGQIKIEKHPSKVIIDDDKLTKEYIDLLDNKKGVYSLEVFGPQSKQLIKNKLSIKPIIKSEANNYSMEYPGND